MKLQCKHCENEIRQEYINDNYGIRRLVWIHNETGAESCYDDYHQARLAAPDAECFCPYCWWGGSWDDCDVKVIKQTQYDPEERWLLCLECGKDVEDATN